MPVQVAIDNALVHVSEAIDCLPRVRADHIGLDPRAGYVYVDLEDECIITKGNHRSLDYYGGFEYVPADNITELGDYKIYSAYGLAGDECQRVLDALQAFNINAA